MTETTLLVLLTISVLWTTYPYTIYILILKAIRRQPSPLEPADMGHCSGEEFALLFCAYNELASMPEKLNNLHKLKLKYPQLLFYAFDDGSSDGTAEIIATRAPFVHLVRGKGRNGKAYGMKTLVRLIERPYLVFTDANVQLDENAINVLSACYKNSTIGGVCGALRYLGAEGSTTANIGGLYWKIEEKIKDLESATGNVMGADGSIFSVRRSTYPEFPDTVLDDFTVSMAVVFSGLRLIKCNEVIAYENLVTKRGDEFARKIRIAARSFHTHLYLASKRKSMKPLDKFKYVSHKLIRWLGALGLFSSAICLLALAANHGVYAFVLTALMLIMLALVGLSAKSGPLAKIAEICLAMIATLIGVVKAVQGKRFQVWTPPKSR